MEMRDLLEKMMKFAGEKVGQKPGDQWRGSDKAPPGKKLVGDSILKDLSKGPTPKTKEQELSEEFQAFLEAEFKDTVDKRPRRASDRHPRGHEPKSGYKTIKTDEAVGGSHYQWKLQFSDGKQVIYNQNNPYYKDATAASDIEYSLKSNKGAKLLSATKDGEKFEWESLLEGWESGPEEYEEPYDDADDWYDRKRQEKIDAETEKEWAKRPQEKVYYLSGRGPNMEQNYRFPGEYKTQDEAMAAREKIMADPKTPHPEHISIHSYTQYLDQTNEAIDSDIVQGMGQDTFNRAGHNPIRDENDYIARRSAAWNTWHNPKTDPETKAVARQTVLDLDAQARARKYIASESRAHKTLSTFFKNRELQDKFAKGELTIPTPQERAELQKKLDAPKKQVKEYGATNVSPYGQPATTPSVDPKQLAQGMQQFKAATGSTAPTTNLAKAIDTLSQGKLPTQQMVKDMQPAMKDLATITQNPNLASGAAKTAFQQANQTRIKQQQLAKK